MIIDLTEEEIRVIRLGLQELPIKVALQTLANLDDKVIKAKTQSVTMAKGEEA